MICPKCKEQGKKSNVFSGMMLSTAMMHHPYWNEEGVYHNHDFNIITREFSCSRGHRITESGHSPCPAGDFGGLTLKVE